MNVYFACSPSRQHLENLKECDVQNILVSYAFIKDASRLKELLGEYRPKNFILDSGAFSVWSKGDTVDIEAYARFAKNFQALNPSNNLYVVNLDVLPGKFGQRPSQTQVEESARAGWDNMLLLESKGLKVIPVFHQHEDWAWLEKMRAHTDYIGISPANDVSMEEKLEWLNKVFFRIRNTIKTHGFAVTSHHQRYNFPFFSVDSSSWTTPARFGRIPIFKDNLSMSTVDYKNKDDIVKYWEYLRHIGIEKIGADSWKDRTKLAIKSYQRLEFVATRLWRSRGITYEERS